MTKKVIVVGSGFGGISSALRLKAKGYEVLLLDSPIVSHLMQKLETTQEKMKFTRVDSDHIDNLIQQDEERISKLSDKEQETLKPLIEGLPIVTFA